MRSFVSFETEIGRESTPAGREIADVLSQALRRRGVNCDEPDENDDYGWRLDCKVERESLFVLIQLTTDQQDRECWLAIIAPLVAFWSRLLRRQQIGQRRLSEALHGVLTEDQRFRNVLWYTREDWERHPENAAPSPQ